MSFDDALAELPLFPLPGAVLLPGTHLELHVFEPRYQALLAHCLETHRHMGIVQIVGDAEAKQPRIAAIAGVGSIEHHQPLEDGRAQIVLQGRARVHLTELPFKPPFRRAEARVIEDVIATPERKGDGTALRTALVSFLDALRKEGPSVTFQGAEGVSNAMLAHHIAQHLLFDAAVRQEILEMRDPSERVARVTVALLAQRTQLAGDAGALN